jgi:hypothetical protein
MPFPFYRIMTTRDLVRVVFGFIDPSSIDKLPSAAKRRVRALDKTPR